MASGWKVSLPCTLAEAEAVDADALIGLEPPPVVMASEAGQGWRLDVYFEEEPGPDALAAVAALAPSAGTPPSVEALPDADWVTMSQAGLEPVVAGRFVVHAGADHPAPPPGGRAFRIDAGLAFGTGQHATTTGCLLMLDACRRRGLVFRDVIDLGTGTGLLAFAAHHLWPAARLTATDIDPVAVRVAAGNAEANRVPLGRLPGRVALLAADGMAHPRLARRGPYDLVIANILAGPLIDLAAPVAEATAAGGTAILSGLLERQADGVARAWRRAGFRLAERLVIGDWATLRLVRVARERRARARPSVGGNWAADGWGLLAK